MKRVIVTQRIEFVAERNETRDCLDQGMIKWLSHLGTLPIPVPNIIAGPDSNYSRVDTWLNDVRPTGVILSGGGDPYHQDARYFVEEAILKYAESLKLPLLGICRGMQRLVLSSGGRLVQSSEHIANRHGITHLHHGYRSVNSFHELTVAHVPQGWASIALGDDGSIEAMRNEHLPWQGWMWHPEREQEPDMRDLWEARRLFGLVAG